MRRIHLVGIACVLTAGCARARVNPYPGASGLSPNDPQRVAVYRLFLPPEPFKVIGEVNYEGAHLASWSGAEKLLRQEAAKAGGDAVIVLDQHSELAGVWTTPGQISGSTSGSESGMLIGNMYSGSYSGHSSYTYSPPTTTPIYHKRIIGLVIRFIQPQTAPEWRQAALYYAGQNRTGDAARALEHAVEIDPADADTWTGLAIVYHVLGQTQKCDEALLHTKKLDEARAQKVREMIQQIDAKGLH